MRKPISRIASMYLERTNSGLNKINHRLISIEAEIDIFVDDLDYLISELDKYEDKSLLSEINLLRNKYVNLCNFLDSYNK